jgi:diguanylate cyclase (GGDEF)-like protein/PAS domain S-box-containing protein
MLQTGFLGEGPSRLESGSVATAQPTANPVAVIHWDTDLRATSWNDGAERIFGHTQSELLGKNVLALLAAPGDAARARDTRHALLAGRCGVGQTARALTRDGRIIVCQWYHAPILDAGGRPVGYASTAVDVTGTDVKQPQHCPPMRDSLTGVASFALYMDRLERAIALSVRSRSDVAVFLIDLDHFAAVNVAFGHRAGDALLASVAERLRRSLRDADSVARLGADQFLALLTHVGGAPGAASVARRIVDCFSEPFVAGPQSIVNTASIGIAMFPGDGDDAEALLQSADAAMLRAKALGCDAFQFSDSSAAESDKMSLERDLGQAIDRDQLELHYQPQIDFKTGSICGAEALVRWRHPTRGLLPPSEFVQLAEESGLIIPIGAWVLRTACASMRAWLDAGVVVPRMTVNVSGRELRRRMIDDVAKVLCDTNIDPSTLELELTETVTMRSSETQPQLLDELKAFGIRLAVDDFGVGYSSLAYLQRFPIDTLKIDRLFVRDCLTNRVNRAIVEAIVKMAHGMKLEVVAEGVETREQADFLKRLGCDGAQGFFYSRPLPAADFEKLVARTPGFATHLS